MIAGSCCGTTGGRRFGFDEFDLRVRVAEFGEFGLEQRVVARVVHQAEVVFKFGIEADRTECFSQTKPDCASTR